MTKKLYMFNTGISGKWVRWLVFLLFFCAGVYAVASVIDALILNSVEFWTGKRPLSSTTTHQAKDAKAVVSAPGQDTLVIEVYRGKTKVQSVALTRLQDAIQLETANGHRFFARDRQSRGADSDTQIVDATGNTLALLDASEWARAQAAMERGYTSCEALAQVWMVPGPVEL